MNFTLDESTNFNVVNRKVHSYLENPENPTADDLIKIIKGVHQSITYSNEDSPEFTALRNQLETEGYIKCQRGWSNGDRVLKPFTLNGIEFKINDKFFCGSAMQWHLEWERAKSL